jgi:hypothetical protein
MSDEGVQSRHAFRIALEPLATPQQFALWRLEFGVYRRWDRVCECHAKALHLTVSGAGGTLQLLHASRRQTA